MSVFRNFTEGDHCPYCRDDAQVLVGYSKAGTEEMAPCPHCEKGDRLEHASSQLVQGTGMRKVEIPRRRPEPWKDGFWQGRPTSGIVEQPALEPLPRHENARRLRELTARLRGVGREI